MSINRIRKVINSSIDLVYFYLEILVYKICNIGKINKVTKVIKEPK